MTIAGWTNFFLSEVGASAALTGLLFVGISINLTKIISIPRLANRALEALLLLGGALLISSIMLMPNAPQTLGGLVFFVGAFVWGSIVWIDVDMWRNARSPYARRTRFLILMNQFALLAYLVGGVLVVVGNEKGIDWLAFGVLLSLVKAVTDAWVLLVEINR